MAFKRYIAVWIFEHYQLRNDYVVARTEKEAKRRIKKRYGKKATGIEIKTEGSI